MIWAIHNKQQSTRVRDSSLASSWKTDQYFYRQYNFNYLHQHFYRLYNFNYIFVNISIGKKQYNFNYIFVNISIGKKQYN